MKLLFVKIPLPKEIFLLFYKKKENLNFLSKVTLAIHHTSNIRQDPSYNLLQFFTKCIIHSILFGFRQLLVPRFFVKHLTSDALTAFHTFCIFCHIYCLKHLMSDILHLISYFFLCKNTCSIFRNCLKIKGIFTKFWVRKIL